MSAAVWSLVAALTMAAVRLRPRIPRRPGGAGRAAEQVGRGRRRRGPPVSARDVGTMPLAVLAVLAVAALGVVVVVIVTAAALVVRRSMAGRRRRIRRRAVDRALPDAVDLLVLTIRAGFTPRDAMAELVDVVDPVVGQAFGEVMDRVDAGDRFAIALDALVDRLGPAALTLVDALASAERTGTPLSHTLTRIADDTRQQRRRAAEAAARELPVRLSIPLVCCTLPAFVLVAIVPLLVGTLSSIDPP
jgi:pilus assembly protein TadC